MDLGPVLRRWSKARTQTVVAVKEEVFYPEPPEARVAASPAGPRGKPGEARAGRGLRLQPSCHWKGEERVRHRKQGYNLRLDSVGTAVGPGFCPQLSTPGPGVIRGGGE